MKGRLRTLRGDGPTHGLASTYKHGCRCEACKDAIKVWQMNHQWKPRKRESTAKDRQRVRLNRYGLTEEQFQALLAAQNGVCAVCHLANRFRRGFHLDHDHVTGEVRGILCHGCNLAMGYMDDSVERLQEAIRYLENPAARQFRLIEGGNG